MESLRVNVSQIVHHLIEEYADGDWLEARGYALIDKKRQIGVVVVVPDYPRHHQAGIVVMTRMVGDTVIIEHDTTDRPLWEELVRAGIPREQIILTYAGEKLPDEEEKS